MFFFRETGRKIVRLKQRGAHAGILIRVTPGREEVYNAPVALEREREGEIERRGRVKIGSRGRGEELWSEAITGAALPGGGNELANCSEANAIDVSFAFVE